MIQIPAFLCRQTDLLTAAGASGCASTSRRASSWPPGTWPMRSRSLGRSDPPVLSPSAGPPSATTTWWSISADWRDARIRPVVFDATHSVQSPGGAGGRSSGQREHVAPCPGPRRPSASTRCSSRHTPRRPRALSDRDTQMPLAATSELVEALPGRDSRARTEPVDAMSYAFVFRAYPTSTNGPAGVEAAGGRRGGPRDRLARLRPRLDYRLRFSQGLPRIPPARGRATPTGRGRVGSTVQLVAAAPCVEAFHGRCCSWRVKRVSLVAVEWGYGLRPGYERLASPGRGLVDVLRSFVGSPVAPQRSPSGADQLHRRGPPPAPRGLCRLPHGLSVKLGRGSDRRRRCSCPAPWTGAIETASAVYRPEHRASSATGFSNTPPPIQPSCGPGARCAGPRNGFDAQPHTRPAFDWPAERGHQRRA